MRAPADGFDTANRKFSSLSDTVSLTMGTNTIFCVSPGAKVSVPDVVV